MRGWRNTVEIILFEISNSMKPYLPVVHAYTRKLRPVTGFLSHKNSMRFPSVLRQPLTEAMHSGAIPSEPSIAATAATPVVAAAAAAAAALPPTTSGVMADVSGVFPTDAQRHAPMDAHFSGGMLQRTVTSPVDFHLEISVAFSSTILVCNLFRAHLV